jgi:hypothetical protein
MLEFIIRMCVASNFCGKWVCDEMMDTLVKEIGEVSYMGHRIQYLISY